MSGNDEDRERRWSVKSEKPDYDSEPSNSRSCSLGDLKVDRADRAGLKREIHRLRAEMEAMEEENHALARRAKDLQLQLFDRRRESQRLFHRSDETKKRLVRFLAEENNLVHEIRFLESERDESREEYGRVAARVNENMASIAAILRDIEFLRGEMETVMDKTGFLEETLPEKFRDVDNIEEKISGSLHALGHLYRKMRAVEKATKTYYYRKEKEIREASPDFLFSSHKESV